MTPEQLELFTAHEGLARIAARQVRSKVRGADCIFEELHQEARLGIMRAAIGFDPALGSRFSTYAYVAAYRSAKRHAFTELRPATGGYEHQRARQRRISIDDLPIREIRVAPVQERDLAAKQVATLVAARLTAARPLDGHIFIACQFGGAEQRDFLAARGATKQAISAGLKRCRAVFDQVAAELRAEAA